MSKDVLEVYLLSDEMVGKVRAGVEGFVDAQIGNDETVSQFLSHYLSEDELSGIVRNVNESMTEQTYAKLADSSLGEKIAHMAIDHVSRKLGVEGAKEILAGAGGGLRGIGRLAAGLFGDDAVAGFLDMLREPAERFLADNINAMLKDNGKEMVSNMIGDEVGRFMDKPVRDLFEGHEGRLRQGMDMVETIYRKVITDHLPKILESIDISKIVRERINDMDVNETEKLIFRVMDKELKAIVWLGALLGLIMGSINIFM